jgi:hypothetical protein
MAPLLLLLLTFEKMGPAYFLPPSGSKSLLQKGDGSPGDHNRIIRVMESADRYFVADD